MQWRDLIGLSDVQAAAERLASVGVETPLQLNERLSERYGASVYLKRQDSQVVRSYKIRGAYNFIASLPPERLSAGVVCASAGNHAQGVAWSCRHLAVPGVVFLPRRTPRQKVARIRALAGDLVELRFAGDSFDDANAAALAYAADTGATAVPTFDHPMTVAGQGTVALETMAQLGRAPDVFVVPVGGGGLSPGSPRPSMVATPRPGWWGPNRPAPRPWCARSRPTNRSRSTSPTISSTAPWCAPQAT